MTLILEPGEPPAEDWHGASLTHLASTLVPDDCPRAIVAVDGRQGAGKSTLAAGLARTWTDAGRAAGIVHTDDLAWWQGFFTWDHLLVDGVLRPWASGQSVAFRPPAWVERGREGAIEADGAASILIVEGVGSSRTTLGPWLQSAVWLQADRSDARRRGLARDGGAPETEAFWDEWDAAERDFLADDRPWERASVIACGTPGVLGLALGADEVLLAHPTHAR